MALEVYTVHIDWNGDPKSKAMTRIVKRKVLKAGNKFLELSAQYAQGPKTKVKIDECFATVEDAHTALSAQVEELVTKLNVRIAELRKVPTMHKSHVFESVVDNRFEKGGVVPSNNDEEHDGPGEFVEIGDSTVN